MTQILSRYAVAMTIAGLIVIAGCGKGDPPAPKASEMSTTAKAQVTAFLELAKSSPNQAPQECSMLMESFNAYVKDFGDAFVPCRDAILELDTLYLAKADKAQIAEKLETLTAAAAALQ